MAENFTKLFGSIIASTVWQEPDTTRITWITMLAMADKNGVISAAVPGLAHMARVSIEQCEAALATFMAPDPYSRSPENEGRRIEIVSGGWRLLNHALYRAKRDDESRRENKREWDRQNRPSGHARVAGSDGEKSGHSPTVRPQSEQSRPNPSQADTDTDTDTELKAKSATADSSTAAGDAGAGDADVTEDEGKDSGDLLGDQQQGKPPRKAMPPCPHDEIIALYHEVLPTLRSVMTWDGMRPKHLRTRWREAPERQSLDWWRKFFVYVGQSDFLMGRVKDFTADLEWLISPKNFAKVIEAKYHQPRGGRS